MVESVAMENNGVSTVMSQQQQEVAVGSPEGVGPPEGGEEIAVWVRGACKSYGRGKNAQHVLKDLAMTVPRGAIYGLLGASGCGKTTLLSCVAGLRHLDNGEAVVFGQPPSPGPALGFMPQEIGLMGDFTIRDTLFYFGRIFGLSSQEIESRIEAMNRLLDLPPHNSFVANLSGGQKRRVSLAATLVHDPELLILDEPTVGLDPILRHRIWEHLSQVTRLENRTVIISTHYIEEARHSDVVGLMRGGALLAEAPPNTLMARYQSNSLEQVFLHLSAFQHARDRRKLEGGQDGEQADLDPELTAQLSTVETIQAAPMPVDTTESSGVVLRHPRPSWQDSWQDLELALKEPSWGNGNSTSPSAADSQESIDQSIKSSKRSKPHKRRRSRFWGITSALLKKNVVRYIRNPGLMLFCFFIAMAQISFFFLTIGREPFYLPLAVISEETPLDRNGNCTIKQGCTDERLSCRFLSQISTDLIKLIPYENESAARAELVAGHVRGLVQLGANFSAAIAARNETGRHTSDETLEMGEVGVTLDMTDVAFGILISEELKNAFGRFFSELLTDCGTNPKYGKLPILFEKPVYGTKKDTYATFMAPGASLCVVTFLGMTVACMPMIIEMMDGVWDRAIVSGVPPSAVLWSHVAVQSVVVFIQHVQVLLVAMLGFEVQNEGSIILFAGITLLEGICGMALGMFISVLTNDIMSATWFTMGSFVPLVMLCGMMWPVQGMPMFLQYVSSAIPLSSGTVALRSVLRKGAEISHPEVVRGLVMGAGWTIALLVSCCLLLKFRQSRK